MAADGRFLSAFSAFFAGRTPYPKLVKEIEEIIAGDAVAADAFLDTLNDLVNLGRLPPDLAAALEPLADAALEIEEVAVESHDDAPTVPAAVQPAGGWADMAAPSPPPPLPETGARERVDDVVLSALVGGFKEYRDRPRRSEAPVRSEDRQLDALVSGFKGARMRRDASRATDGQARDFNLSKAHDGAREKRAGVGTLLKDRFVLDRELGRGGMGIVYAAVDRRRLEAMHAQPYVAVKLLNDELQKHPDALRTLEGEARKAQALAHPNIVTVYDFDRDGGHVFLVMELLEGRGLDQVIKERPTGPMSLQNAAPIVTGICAALTHAHSQGVIHADLKPANVFLPEGGGVKLLDFGISTAGRVAGFDATALGALTGAYASPEMIEGAPRDPRDDVYALGCLVHLLLTGQHPFDRKKATEARDTGLMASRIPSLSRRQNAALQAALAFDRERRAANVDAVRAGLLEESFWSRLTRRRRREPDPLLDSL